MQVNDLVIEKDLDLRKIASTRIINDATLSTGPVIVYGLLVTPINGSSGVTRIYDSAGGSGRLKATIVTDVTVSMLVKFPIPLFLTQGLHISLDSGVDHVMIQYLIC